MRFEDGAAIVRERSAGLCERCRRAGVQTHHRRPRSMGGVHRDGERANLPSNLVRLCLDCHAWAESQREEAMEVGLLLPHDGRSPAEVPIFLQHVNGSGWWLLADSGDMSWCDPVEVEAARTTG